MPHDPPPQPLDILRQLVDECEHPARIIELYYWSIETDLADVMRQYVALPTAVRAALYAFLMLAKDDPASINVRIDPNGEMTLSSPAADDLAQRLAKGRSDPSFVH